LKGPRQKIDGAEDVWMAFLGPDTPALGQRSNAPAVMQNQIAATLAALLGEDYRADVHKAGKPISDVLLPVQFAKVFDRLGQIGGLRAAHSAVAIAAGEKF
jgi:hypothetical protein